MNVGDDINGLLSNPLCYFYPDAVPASAWMLRDCVLPIHGRYVSITKTVDPKAILTLCEVVVYAQGNILLLRAYARLCGKS